MRTAKLIVSQPGQRTRSVEITGRAVSVGRRPDNIICLEGDTNVSKYHAVIEVRDGEYWITDLGSSNGTTVNNERLQVERKLLNNDIICVGGTSTVALHLHEAPVKNSHTEAADAPLPVSQGGVPPAPPPDQQADAPPMPPPAVRKILGLPITVVAGVAVGLVVMAGILGILFGSGAIGGLNAKDPPPASNASAPPSETENPPANNQIDEIPVAPPPTPEPSDTPPPLLPGESAAASTDVTANLARMLAVQISQKSFYSFDPSFVLLINSYLNEYRNAKGYYERASKYREVIDREFINVQGIQPPLIGYVMAMSQSKFVEKSEGGSVWQLPSSVLKEYVVISSATNINEPESSTRIAAAYMRSLLDLFEKENFMYAVACYGMTIDEAGKVRTELEKKDPGGQGRYDFWKMKNAGVVRGDQVERVARFFAAGIVCENPRQFNLNEKQLSSLY